MKNYTVKVSYTFTGTVTVNAESKAHAKEIVNRDWGMVAGEISCFIIFGLGLIKIATVEKINIAAMQSVTGITVGFSLLLIVAVLLYGCIF